MPIPASNTAGGSVATLSTTDSAGAGVAAISDGGGLVAGVRAVSVNGFRAGSRGRGAFSSQADRRATSRSRSSRAGAGVRDCAGVTPTPSGLSVTGTVPAADDSQAASTATLPVNTATREEVIAVRMHRTTL